MAPGDQDQFICWRELHDLAGREQRARCFLASDHQVAEPRTEPMTGVILHRTHLGRGAECVAHAFCGSLVVGRKAHAYMAVVEDRIVLAVCLLDLIQALCDQDALQPVSRHEREGRLEEIQTPKRGKLIEHQQQPVTTAPGVQLLGELRPI